MPTVDTIDDLRVVIYPNDHRPAHVHIIGHGCEAVCRFNCPEGPPELRENYRFAAVVKYQPLIRPEDKPSIWLNEKIMSHHRDQMKKFYYDPSKYGTYLEQLGIKYPTVRLRVGAP